VTYSLSHPRFATKVIAGSGRGGQESELGTNMLGEDIQLRCEDGEVVLRSAAQTSTANKIEQMQRTAASMCRGAAAEKTDDRPLGADRVYESKTKVRAVCRW